MQIIMALYKGIEVIDKGMLNGAVNDFIQAENSILENWHGSRLAPEIEAALVANDRKVDEVKSFLDTKYYWNVFRVDVVGEQHMYPGALIVPTVLSDGKQGQIAIRYSQVDPGKLQVSKVEIPPPIPEAMAERKQAARDKLAKFAGGSGIGGAAGDAVATMTKTKDTAEKVFKGFQKAAHIAGNVLKYFGPIASTVAAFASLFFEEGTTNIVDEMRAGFSDMNDNFKLLGDQIAKVQGTLSAETAFRSAYVTYRQEVKSHLDDLIGAESLLNGNRGDANYWQTMVDRCTPSALRPTPFDMLLKLHNNFFNDPFNTLHVVIQDWAASDRQKLLAALTTFMIDAVTLVGYIPKCRHYRKSSGFYADTVSFLHETAEANKLLFSLKAKILAMERENMYGWPMAMKSKVETLLKENKNLPVKTLTTTVKAIISSYFWNKFQVYVVKKGQPLHTRSAKYNPEYARIVETNDLLAAIAWTAKDGTGVKYDTNPAANAQCHQGVANGDVIFQPIFSSGKQLQAVFAFQGEWYYQWRNCLLYGYEYRYGYDELSYQADDDNRFAQFNTTCRETPYCTYKDKYVLYMINTGQGY